MRWQIVAFYKINMDSFPNNKKLSLILLGTQMALGGAQKLLFEHAQWLQQNGHQATVAFFYDRDGLHEKWQADYGIPIHKLSGFHKQAGAVKRLMGLLTGLWNLWKILRSERFDAIIAFTHDSNLLGLPLALLAGIPARIGTNLGEIRGMSLWRDWLHTLLVNVSVIQVLVASSARTRRNSIERGIKPERIKVIYNSISPFEVNRARRVVIRRQLGLGERDIFVLTIGRLVYEKGHDFLVEAMDIVVRSQSNVVAGICGSGPLHEHLSRQIAVLELGNKMRLLGQWGDIQELLESADIFVLPSRWEGLPMAMLEAMMAELPVVAFNVEGVEEVIEDGVQGFLAPMENPKELAKSILQIAEDARLREQMGKAARERVLTAYTADRMCGEYLDVIFDCLARSKSTS